MARARRTRFAASFVAIVTAGAGAPGCSHETASGGGGGTGPGTGVATGSAGGSGTGAPTPRTTWHASLGNDGTTCWATPQIDCSGAPPGVSCNPPASARVPCPTPMPADGFTIITFDGSHCLLADGKTPIACPSNDLPPPPPDAAPPPPSPPDVPVAAAPPLRRWAITQGDKLCYARLTDGMSCPTGATCNPPGPRKVTCPPYSPGSDVVETAPGKCQSHIVLGGGPCPPKYHCNPPPPRDVELPCP